MNRLSDRLDTSPAQDRVLEEVVDDRMDVFAEHRGAFGAARSTLAEALTGDVFDGAAFDGLRKEQEAAFGKVHGAARAALEKLFDVLEPDQREVLADLVSRGPRGHHCRGHRRHLHAA